MSKDCPQANNHSFANYEVPGLGTLDAEVAIKCHVFHFQNNPKKRLRKTI